MSSTPLSRMATRAEKYRTTKAETRADADRERFNRLSPLPPPPPPTALRAQGFREIAKQQGGGLYVSVMSRTRVGISQGVRAALGHPRRVRLWLSRDNATLVIHAAAPDDQTAYRLAHRDNCLPCARIVNELKAAGWGEGRYTARIESGYAIVDRAQAGTLVTP